MTTPGACSHCGTELRGPYCWACGQEVRTGRLATPAIVREGVAQFLDLETGLLRTLRELLLRPERVVRGWWEGHTRPWVHPLRFFLLSFALAQFVAWRTGALAGFASGYVEARAGGSGSEATLVAILADYFVVLAAGGLVLPVLVAAVVGRRTLAEQVVFTAFVFGQLAVAGSVLLLVGWMLPAIPGAMVLVILTPVYLARAIRRVFETGWLRTAIGTIGLLVGSLVTATLIAGIIDGATGGMPGG